MQRTSIQKQGGFSLIEVLVYIAVLFFVMAGSIGLILSMQQLLIKHKAEQIMLRTSATALEQLVLDVKNATGVDTSASTLGSTDSVLVLETESDDITFEIVSGRLTRTQSGTTLPLTDTRATVTRYEAILLTSSISSLVANEIDITVTLGAQSFSETFSVVRILQQSYE
jgi:type II secretory pathway pseudopilin PulG